MTGDTQLGGASEMIRRHARQRYASMLSSPIWVGGCIAVMRYWLRYRVEDIENVRAEYQAIRTQSDGPILICANHLTMIDSLIIAWSIGSGTYWVTHPNELPWNTPESTNFGQTWYARLAIFLAKCIPITRGGAREDVGNVLERVRHLLGNGETALIFPEAGRSRSGRVEDASAAWGVGRIVGSIPGCRVLCVYMRGQHQETWGDYPVKHERIDVSLTCIEPKSETKGIRRSRDIGQQIVRQLVCMEEDYFDARK